MDDIEGLISGKTNFTAEEVRSLFLQQGFREIREDLGKIKVSLGTLIDSVPVLRNDINVANQSSMHNKLALDEISKRMEEINDKNNSRLEKVEKFMSDADLINQVKKKWYKPWFNIFWFVLQSIIVTIVLTLINIFTNLFVKK